MMYQNVTLKLDKDLLRQAKIAAAQQKTSLSQLMVNALKNLVNKKGDYERAQKKAISLIKKGYRLGGGPYYPTRSSLYDRHGF